MVERLLLAAGSAATLTACGMTGETVQAEGGSQYRVERVDTGETKLPTNSELKMVDGDLAKYSMAGCDVFKDIRPEPTRCDVFAQSDPSGALLGFVFLVESDEGVKIDSDLEPNKDKGFSTGCWIGGTLVQYTDAWKPVKSITDKFDGEFMYMATEIDPGEYRIREVDRVNGDGDGPEPPNTAGGVWYVKKDGDKLRINQDRWNPCFRTVDVDEVFTRVLTLTKS